MHKSPLFEVVVIATMSAGKSTIINALIGHELLHSANEATTATITRIHNKDGLTEFIGKAYSYDNKLLLEEVINAETLRQWNADPQIKTIDLTGDIQGLHNDKAELVIYDTPGPNNSQDDNHEALTMQVINDGNYGLILYVLNTTQLGVNDDRALLEKIKTALEIDPHKEIVFILNKADCLDEEKGERLDKVITNAKTYLENIGFVKPTIIPTTANYALVLQKALHNISLTRSERASLKNALDILNNQLIASAIIPNELKLKTFHHLNQPKASGKIELSNGIVVNKKHIERAISRTGFGTIQLLLQQKLAQTQFHLPHQNKEIQ